MRFLRPHGLTRHRTLALPLGAVGAVAGLALATTAADAMPAGTTHSTSSSVKAARPDTTSKAAVAALWRSEWKPATTSAVSLSGGSTTSCQPFQTSAATLSTMLRAINFARALSGVAPLTSLTDSDSRAAKSALILAANQTLSHSPSPRAKCYSPIGASTARQSDLGLWAYSTPSWRPTVASVVGSYLTDPGKVNADAAHRIWLLRAAARRMSTGFAVARAGGWTWVSNNTVVFPNSGDVRGGPKFHAWPGSGYFPIQLEPHGRWSVSASSKRIGFKHAKVRVTRNGHPVKVRSLLPSNSFGDHSLTWQLASRPKVGTYCVKVTGISHSKTYSWCTDLFRP